MMTKKHNPKAYKLLHFLHDTQIFHKKKGVCISEFSLSTKLYKLIKPLSPYYIQHYQITLSKSDENTYKGIFWLDIDVPIPFSSKLSNLENLIDV